MINEIIGKALSVVATLLFCISYQINTRRGLLLTQTAELLQMQSLQFPQSSV